MKYILCNIGVNRSLAVPGTGLEPARVAPHDPKSCASASFATPACEHSHYIKLDIVCSLVENTSAVKVIQMENG